MMGSSSSSSSSSMRLSLVVVLGSVKVITDNIYFYV